MGILLDSLDGAAILTEEGEERLRELVQQYMERNHLNMKSTEPAVNGWYKELKRELFSVKHEGMYWTRVRVVKNPIELKSNENSLYNIDIVK